MPAGTLSKLFVRIGADTSDFQKNMGNVQKRMASVGKSIGNVGKGMTKWVTGPIALAGGAMLGLAKKTGDYADSILDMASATGHSTDMIQDYQHVADRAGVSTDAFTTASQTLMRQMTRGTEGSATLRQGLEELGLTFEELEEASPDERMEMIMHGLRGIENEGERALVGTQLLRNGYEELAPILNMTEEEMKAVTDQARKTGEIMGEDALHQANEFRMGLDELKSEFGGLFRSIAVEFMPVLTDVLMPVIKENVIPLIRGFADTITGLIERFTSLEPRTQKMILAGIGIAAALGPVLIVVAKLITVFSTLMPILGAIAGVLSGPVIIAIGLIVAAFIVWRKWGDNILEFFKGFGRMIVEIFQTAWRGIKKIINAIISGYNLLLKGLNKFSIDIPDWVPGLGGKKFGINIPKIPKLALGGHILSGGSALVGEIGPEIVNLPRGATVRPLDNKNTVQQGPLLKIDNLTIRKESDIDKIADKIRHLQVKQARGVGV